VLGERCFDQPGSAVGDAVIAVAPNTNAVACPRLSVDDSAGDAEGLSVRAAERVRLVTPHAPTVRPDAGATGTMPSALLPDLLRPVIDNHVAGQRAEAAAAYARVLPLVNYENRQCGLRAAKSVMAEGRVIKSEVVRHPLDQIHPRTRAGLIEIAREVDPIALCWGH